MNEQARNEEYYKRYFGLYDVIYKSYIDIYTIEGINYVKNNGQIDGLLNDSDLFVFHYLELLKANLAVNICKLYTDWQKGTNTIKHLAKYIKKCGKNLQNGSTSLKRDKKNKVESIKKLRNTYLSHNDLNRKKVSVKMNDMKEIIEEIRIIFNNLCFPDIDSRVKPFTDSVKYSIDFRSKMDQMRIMIRDKYASDACLEIMDEENN